MPTTPKSYAQLCRQANAGAVKQAPRVSRSKRGYDRRWYKYSKLYLARNPTCVRCFHWGDRDNPLVVDHIVPLSQGGTNYDPSNSQTLCRRCNSVKARTEDHRGVPSLQG